MNRLHLLLLAGLWLLCQIACAQSDSTTQQLWQQLRHHPQADTSRVNLLNKLADYDIHKGSISFARRDSLAVQALQLAQRLDDFYGQAYACYNLATSSDYALKKQVQAKLLQALPLAERSGNKPLLIRILSLLAFFSEKQGLGYSQRAIAVARALGSPVLLKRSYQNQADYFANIEGNNYLALQATLQELPVAQQTHMPVEEVDALGDVAERYMAVNDYPQALLYLQQALGKAKTLAPSPQARYQKGWLLYDLGECNLLMGHYAQAQVAYQRALPFADQASTIMQRRRGLADVYERQRNPKALAYARQLMQELQQPPYAEQLWRTRSQVCLTLGRYYLRTRQADSAVYYSRYALHMAQASTAKEPLRDALQLMAQAYAQQKDYAQAYAYQNRYLGLKDTLSNEQTARQVTAIRFTQDLARQKGQIALLTRNQQLQAEAARRQRLLLLAALAVLTLIGGLVFVLARNNRLKQRANLLLEQQKAELQVQRDQTTQALTDLRATQAQLIQKEKMASLGELTAGIAHEIQNPLNFVNNFADVSAELVAELKEAQAAGDTEEVVALAEDLGQNLGKIHQHGQRASSIVRGMLEHSRASTGERQPTDLNTLADEYLRLAYHGLRAKDKSFNAELKTNFAPGLPLVEAVSQDLGRVLLNLFNNAFYAVQLRQKQGEPGYQPTITVSTKQLNQQVQIRVADNGTGIRDAVREKIFQPFFTTKPTGEGTGLGLSLSYDIITKGHGGTLAVESEAGQGTEFIITLPI
ncbi:ATP-binding protein [Hymenobacter crusticola]|uniref:histidine kinase n=1 Tax=Hymenobacter crusticola TaxID=1770526 RepID=A0A243WJ26_9BACT|nr:ATP-binding protein [Hymenobacter crusticola]OUJ75895.1 hypothetical protein BXP70_00960 [Hymenobacter crusticola]